MKRSFEEDSKSDSADASSLRPFKKRKVLVDHNNSNDKPNFVIKDNNNLSLNVNANVNDSSNANSTLVRSSNFTVLSQQLLQHVNIPSLTNSTTPPPTFG